MRILQIIASLEKIGGGARTLSVLNDGCLARGHQLSAAFYMRGEGEAAVVNRELSTPMLRRAFELGVNYYDTAVGYCNQDSQRAVGEAFEGMPELVFTPATRSG